MENRLTGMPNRTNLDATFYVWSQKDGTYKSWNGVTGTLQDGKIAPWQSVWVKANGESPVLSLSDSVRSSGGVFEKKVSNPQIRLRLSKGGSFSESVIFFDEQAKVGKDNLDAFKLQPLTNEFLSLGTSSDNDPTMDIQALPFGDSDLELNLDIYGNNLSGDHMLDWKTVSIPEDWHIILVDEKNESTYEITGADTLNFELLEYSKESVKSTQKQPASPIQILRKKKGETSRFKLLIKQSQTVTNEPESDLPLTFELQQNYPNPFNPSTTIAYGVPKTGKVTLEVFDILGRKVATLLNGENKTAGRYTLNFNASNLASGMYIYRLRAGNVVMIKKLTLIK